MIPFLKKARAAGLTNRDIGKLIGVSAQTVSNWRDGVYDPSRRTTAAMERADKVLDTITPEQRNRMRNGKARRAWVEQHREQAE
jgi:DNA-binding XRE family transcriptional regulator